MGSKEMDQRLLLSDVVQVSTDGEQGSSELASKHHTPRDPTRHCRSDYVTWTLVIAFLTLTCLTIVFVVSPNHDDTPSPNRSAMSSISSEQANQPDIPRSGSSRRRLPSALIIGAKKSGTRALLEFLRSHPHVKALAQESHFFDKHYGKGLDWYRKRMPASRVEQVVIEKTPSYFITAKAPRRVWMMSQKIKLIVVVRDPVRRAISDYAQAIVKRPDLPVFEKMAITQISSEMDTSVSTFNATSKDDLSPLDPAIQGRVNQQWGVIRIGLYARHIRRWFRYFPRSSFHFVSGERLISNPAQEIQNIEKFLNIYPYVTSDHFYFNSTKGFPCLKYPLGNRHACLGKSKGRQHPNVQQTVLNQLHDFYRPRNNNFYNLVGEDFGWS